MIKEEKAKQYALHEDLYIEDGEYTDRTIEMAFEAGYEAAENESRDRAIKAINTVLGEITVDVMKNDFKLGINYRTRFLRVYNGFNRERR